MGTTRSSLLLAVLVTGMTLVYTTDAFKSEAAIVAEIQSMATGIMTECTTEVVQSYCSSFSTLLHNARDLITVCLALNNYVKCQTANCKSQSPALVQLLTDAMVVPYCTNMANYPLGSDFQSIAVQVSQMSNLCTFLPDMDCDQELNTFLGSTNIKQACWSEGVYAKCLQNKCSSPTVELQQRIANASNDPLCRFSSTPRPVKTEAQIVAEIKSMAAVIKGECTIEEKISGCHVYESRLDNATYIVTTCSTFLNYIYCKSVNCINQSPTLVQVLSDAMAIPYCTDMQNFPKYPDVLGIADRVSEMSHLCNYTPGANCDQELSDFTLSTSLEEACSTQYWYVNCLQNTCSWPSADLLQKISYARNDPLCASFPTPTTRATTTGARYPNRIQQDPATQAVNLADIRQLSNQLATQCSSTVITNGCSSMKSNVDTAWNVQSACTALQTYFICMTRNCLNTVSAPFLSIYCGQPTVSPDSTAISKVVNKVTGMIQQCPLSLGVTCSEYQDTLLTSQSLSDVCKAEKSYADCLGNNCFLPSSDLLNMIKSAKNDPTCQHLSGSCSLVEVSALFILMAVVMQYL